MSPTFSNRSAVCKTWFFVTLLVTKLGTDLRTSTAVPKGQRDIVIFSAVMRLVDLEQQFVTFVRVDHTFKQ
jgi:hypothetical protein